MAPVTYAQNGPIASIRLTRPDKRNALNLEMCQLLSQHFAAVDADPDLRIVIVSGEGEIFCAGADLKERQDKDAAWVRVRRLSAFAAYAAIRKCSKPVVTLVHGAVVGSGGEMALAGDFIIAADDATFKFPEPQWGTVGATQRLQRAIGAQRAKDLLFTGRVMAADEALACGLVARMVKRSELELAGQEIAAQIAAAPALAIRLTKQAMDQGREASLDTGLQIELAAIDHNLAAGDWAAGISSFVTRKKNS
ncbi:enoyl-CoA hydratase/isomerase family protein [Corticibacterium sp. UT-5YL-CI-8]|nr:enoyl-CoA hydratase/isomerase family protein [Tianweitania sp. UT-5YL-CI-8]